MYGKIIQTDTQELNNMELAKLFFARDKLDRTIEKIEEAMDIWHWSDEPATEIDQLLTYLNEESIRVNREILKYLAEEKQEQRRNHFK